MNSRLFIKENSRINSAVLVARNREFIRRFLIGLCFLFYLFSSSAYAYSFIVFGDNQGNYRVLNDLLAKVKQEKNISFIIHTGDCVPYGEEAHYIKYRKIMAALKIPYYQAMGNHDGVYGGWRRFKKYYGPSYYSFDHQNSHFIVLDNAFKQNFDDKQFSWLKNDLAKTTARYKFVIMHKPTFDPSETYKDHIMSGRAVIEELMALFTKYKVNYVLAGHIHGYAKSERNGVTYIVSGGGGGPLYLPRDFGGFYNYVRIDVEDRGITDSVKRVYD
ncbi:MAG: metallophosphoesterase [bacterium]